MAVTGIIMIAYLIAHMIGNLHAFQGAQAYNDYALWLRTFGEPALPYRTILTAIEIVLSVSVIGHIWAAVSLWRQAKRARPVGYVTKKANAQTYASRTMRWGGVIVLAFIIYHLLDMTAGTINLADGPRRALRPAGRQLHQPLGDRVLRDLPGPARACTCGTGSGASRRPWARATSGASAPSTRPRSSSPPC